MNGFVERTCTEVGAIMSKSLAAYRECDTYVLLGAPGSGKTRAFEEEWRQWENGLYLTAHDFIELHRPEEWRGKTLFIDALDEVRLDSASPEPLGRIRAKLDELGKPRFRLSCRDADWYSAIDRGDLAKVSRNGQVVALKLDPLSDKQTRELLALLPTVGEAAANGFIAAARERNLETLLRNPLSLKLLADTVSEGDWPQSRKETFEAACRSLLRERNERHDRAHQSTSFDLRARLNAAGRLCAVALLSGKRGYLWNTVETYQGWVALNEVPCATGHLLESVLRSRLFESPADGRFAPLHQHVAEFLAGRYLASRVNDGLPAARAIALMAGGDGGVVSPMRGLWAWFAAHCTVAREELIDGDPLGVVLYGDVKQFSVADKRRILDGVRGRAEVDISRIPSHCWFSSRWADVTTENAMGMIRERFAAAPNSEADQLVASSLLGGLQRGAMPDLKPLLLSIVRDGRLFTGTRRRALHSLIVQFQDDPALLDYLDELLTGIGAERLTDPDDELTGRLLCELYPQKRTLADVGAFLHVPKAPSLIGHYNYFWKGVLRQKTEGANLAEAHRLFSRFRELKRTASLVVSAI